MVIGGHGSVPVQLNDTAQAAARVLNQRARGLVELPLTRPEGYWI